MRTATVTRSQVIKLGMLLGLATLCQAAYERTRPTPKARANARAQAKADAAKCQAAHRPTNHHTPKARANARAQAKADAAKSKQKVRERKERATAQYQRKIKKDAEEKARRMEARSSPKESSTHGPIDDTCSKSISSAGAEGSDKTMSYSDEDSISGNMDARAITQRNLSGASGWNARPNGQTMRSKSLAENTDSEKNFNAIDTTNRDGGSDALSLSDPSFTVPPLPKDTEGDAINSICSNTWSRTSDNYTSDTSSDSIDTDGEVNTTCNIRDLTMRWDRNGQTVHQIPLLDKESTWRNTPGDCINLED